MGKKGGEMVKGFHSGECAQHAAGLGYGESSISEVN